MSQPDSTNTQGVSPQPKAETGRSWWRPTFRRAVWMASVALLVSLCGRPVRAQLGIDDAAIVAALEQMNSMMQSSVGSPLSSIQSTQSQISQFEQSVIWPVVAIQQAQQSAASFLSAMQQQNAILNMARSSAQLPVTQQLETLSLSGNPNNVSTLTSSYAQVYGPLPTVNGVPGGVAPQVLTMIDMTDAQAQDALKKAIQLDALAAQEMAVSQNLLSQLQTAAPGSAPILAAQASAWVLQANAYSQSGMAELLRTRSAWVAGNGTMSKQLAISSHNSSGVVQNMLKAAQQ